MKMITKTKRVGGSLMVVIPKGIVDDEMLVPGQEVELKVKKVKRKYFGAFKQLGPWTREDEFDIRD